MFLRQVSSLLKDTLFNYLNIKYKIKSLIEQLIKKLSYRVVKLIITNCSILFFSKLALFYKRNIEYICLTKVSIGIYLLYNFLYYQHCIYEQNLRKNHDLSLFQDVVANLLIPNLTIASYDNNKENYVFCSKAPAIPTISKKKLFF